MFLHIIITCLVHIEYIFVKGLIKHPVYKNQYIGFDLKYDVDDLIDLDESELREIYKNKVSLEKLD